MKKALLLGMLLVAWGFMPRAEAVAPRSLVEVADLGAPTVSPDGSRVAFRLEQASIERNTYDTTWYVQDMKGPSYPTRVADGGVPLRDSAGVSLPAIAVWSPDGRWVYYRALVGGEIDVWRAAADGSLAEPVTLDPADVLDFKLSADGKRVEYSVGATREAVIKAEQEEYDHGVRIDETVPIGQGLFRSGHVDGRPATQRFGGDWFDRVPLLADAPVRWKMIDLATRQRRDLAPSERPPSATIATDLMPYAWAFASDPASSRTAVLTRIGEAAGLLQKPDTELLMLPSPKAVAVRCTADLCRKRAISSVQWRPGSDEILFTVTDPREGLAQSIYRWNVQTGAVLPVAASSGLLNGGRDWLSTCGLSPTALACVAAEAGRPPRLETVELGSGQRQVLFEPNAALASELAAIVRPRLLRWTDAQGREFIGQFFPARRTGVAPPPLFVTYYSCSGFLRGGVGDEWPLASLAERGIAALCINRRPYRLDAVERYDQGLTAVVSAVGLLASTSEIDGSRVGMGGLSFGSEVALWVASNSKMLSAVSVTSPVASPLYYLFGSLKGEAFSDGLRNLWGLGSPDETPERWRTLSPVFKLDRIQAPILMQMPEQEYLYALDYAISLIRSDRADLYVFPNEPHQKFQPRHKLASYDRNLDWFCFWLLGYEDPDPRKADQYKQWRLMKAGQSQADQSRTDRVG
ncbi:acylaminoacyl-peptidase [plant metagenome]|uniref:Acylaminoacyl-peptidase n=1 Tax=plant metagenome TaxID=1297885 RepID=A0A484S065_9ZZZZ